MPRLRNTATGVVVNVDERTVAGLPGKWVPVEKPKPAPVKRGRKKVDEDEQE